MAEYEDPTKESSPAPSIVSSEPSTPASRAVTPKESTPPPAPRLSPQPSPNGPSGPLNTPKRSSLVRSVSTWSMSTSNTSEYSEAEDATDGELYNAVDGRVTNEQLRKIINWCNLQIGGLRLDNDLSNEILLLRVRAEQALKGQSALFEDELAKLGYEESQESSESDSSDEELSLEEYLSKVVDEESYSLFDKSDNDIMDGPLFEHTPKVEDVEQNALQDCYLMAALISIVHSDPSKIVNAMRDNGDGTVTVRFYRCRSINNFNIVYDEPFDVTVPKWDSRLDWLSSETLWPNIFERAYFCYQLKLHNPPDEQTEKTYKNELSYGAQANHAFNAILGPDAKESVYFGTHAGAPQVGFGKQLLTKDDIRNIITTALLAKEPIAIGFHKGAPWGCTTGHQYAITSIDGDKVTLLNPHGKSGYGKTGSLFKRIAGFFYHLFIKDKVVTTTDKIAKSKCDISCSSYVLTSVINDQARLKGLETLVLDQSNNYTTRAGIEVSPRQGRSSSSNTPPPVIDFDENDDIEARDDSDDEFEMLGASSSSSSSEIPAEASELSMEGTHEYKYENEDYVDPSKDDFVLADRWDADDDWDWAPLPKEGPTATESGPTEVPTATAFMPTFTKPVEIRPYYQGLANKVKNSAMALYPILPANKQSTVAISWPLDEIGTSIDTLLETALGYGYVNTPSKYQKGLFHESLVKIKTYYEQIVFNSLNKRSFSNDEIKGPGKNVLHKQLLDDFIKYYKTLEKIVTKWNEYTRCNTRLERDDFNYTQDLVEKSRAKPKTLDIHELLQYQEKNVYPVTVADFLFYAPQRETRYKKKN